MNDDHITSVAQIEEVLKLSHVAIFTRIKGQQAELYEWIETKLTKLRYLLESRKNKSLIKRYLIQMSGYSEGAIDKMIAKKDVTGTVTLKKRTQWVFPTRYGRTDILLLAEMGEAMDNPNGTALKKSIVDMYTIYRDVKFERLSHISVSHIYNLKKSSIYREKVLVYEKTKPTSQKIGERKKPDPEGIPGFIRIDTVHQGDKDGQKGMYHVNVVDEVTQYQFVGSVDTICEEHMIPLLREMIDFFPYTIVNFHSDNGSEYINHVVSNLLNKLHIRQTKSRARKSGDNALVEGKNNAVVRKTYGYLYIPKGNAARLNVFNKVLNHHLNFHRHSAFATDVVGKKGRIVKRYETYLTPVQKLLSIPECEKYLKPNITKDSISAESMKMTHMESGKKVNEAKALLFKEIFKKA
jgi:hypothetical protein